MQPPAQHRIHLNIPEHQAYIELFLVNNSLLHMSTCSTDRKVILDVLPEPSFLIILVLVLLSGAIAHVHFSSVWQPFKYLKRAITSSVIIYTEDTQIFQTFPGMFGFLILSQFANPSLHLLQLSLSFLNWIAQNWTQYSNDIIMGKSIGVVLGSWLASNN